MQKIDLEQKCNGEQLPIPIDALYLNKDDEREQFNKYDSPNAFWSLTDEQQAILLEWCQRLDKRQAINLGRTSYGLKHLFTHDCFYVYNGAFKGGMLLAGFKAISLKYSNWHFNVSERSIKQLGRHPQ